MRKFLYSSGNVLNLRGDLTESLCKRRFRHSSAHCDIERLFSADSQFQTIRHPDTDFRQYRGSFHITCGKLIFTLIEK